MRGSIEWFIDNPRVANLLAAVLILGGLLAIPNTRQETLPNVPLERIGVVSKLAGSPPEVTEQLLCTPLETAIEGIEGITDVRSEAREGLCSITVDVLEGYDVQTVRDLIAARTVALDSLPETAEPPVVEEVIFRNRVARVLLTGDARPRELYNLARGLRRDLLSTPAIAQVEVEGLPSRELGIEVSRQDLYRYDLTFAELADSIRNQVTRVTGGLLRTDQSNALLQAGEQISDPEAYREVEVRRGPDGDVLYLDRIARLEDGFGRDSMGAWLNGQPAAALDIYRVGNQDVVDVAAEVRKFVHEVQLPEGMRLILWEDSAIQYESRSQLLWSSALQGLALLVVILGVFLGLRLAGWVGLGIPVSMLGACILLPLFDQSFNTISLFAFILVLGIVVDDAAVVGESVYEQGREDGPTRAAVIAGTQRVAGPVTYAILTTILAFAPMLFLPGPEGEFMRVVPIVAIGILILSLAESLWILPAHLHSAMKRPPDRSDRFSSAVNRRFDRWVQERFMPFLRWATTQRYPLLAAFFGIFLLCLAFLNSGWLTVMMFSKVDGDIVMVDVAFPEGTSNAQVARAVESLQQSAQALADQLNSEGENDVVTDIYAEQGRRNKYSTAHDAGAHLRARVSIALAPGENGSNADSVARLWREQQGPIRGAVSQRFHASLNEVKPDIHINLFHDDLEILETLSVELQRQIERIDGTHEISNSMTAHFTSIGIDPRPGAELAGVTRQHLGTQVNAAFQGSVVDRLPEGDHDVPVVLRLPANQSDSIWHLEQLPVTLSDGSVAPLGALAELSQQSTPAVISHYDNQRSATITAYLDEHLASPGQVMAELEQNWLAEAVQRYPGTKWSVAGKPKAIAEFMTYLTISYALAIAGMFFILTVAFGTYWQPMLILTAIPFGLVGGFLGHALLGYDLTLWSIVGIVAVSGVVVNDNLVLISAVNELKAAGREVREAVLEAVGQRFRPVILTTLTTFAGVAPLIMEQSTQARFLAPMAVAVAFGVLFATFITLLMVPSLCLVGEDIRDLKERIKARRFKTTEQDSVEQAYQAGQRAAISGFGPDAPQNPYTDDVLRASWEAGLDDPDPSIRVATQ